jgi:hypothetical protein
MFQRRTPAGKSPSDKLGRDAKPSKVNIDEGIGQYTRLIDRTDQPHLRPDGTITDADGARMDRVVVEMTAGRVLWIDKDNFHIVRAESDIASSMPPRGARNISEP